MEAAGDSIGAMTMQCMAMPRTQTVEMVLEIPRAIYSTWSLLCLFSCVILSLNICNNLNFQTSESVWRCASTFSLNGQNVTRPTTIKLWFRQMINDQNSRLMPPSQTDEITDKYPQLHPLIMCIMVQIRAILRRDCQVWLETAIHWLQCDASSTIASWWWLVRWEVTLRRFFS